MLSRNQEQEKVMLAIYQYLFYQKMNQEDVKEILENVFEMDYEDISIFAKEVTVKTLLHQEEIDKDISAHLVKWTLDRLNMVTHAILLLAIGEYRYTKECNKAEIINIAVNLAKTYLDDKDYKFVNAILDNILKDGE